MTTRGLLLFDIDGVIRDVTNSYRLAIQETVKQFTNWLPSISEIDNLKQSGNWNNDWDTSEELIKRHLEKKSLNNLTPSKQKIINVFNNFYFGGEPNEKDEIWTGFIKNEPLLVNQEFFQQLTNLEIKWGFVSGAETPSAKFLLEKRLSLKNPPLIAMEDAPDKPDPKGLLRLAKDLLKADLGVGIPPIAFLGDTVADIMTINNAKKEYPNQTFLSFAIAPPHLRKANSKDKLKLYEINLKKAGADNIISNIYSVLDLVKGW